MKPWLLIPLVCLASCTKELQPPDLNRIYGEAAKSEGPERNPVIVIPGILGSKLRAEDGTLCWGAFTRELADPQKPHGAQLIAHPMKIGVSLNHLKDDVIPDGALDTLEVSLLGIPIANKAYANILATLGAGGYRDETLGEAGAVDYGEDHYTCFQFDYDWRRDNVENAHRLYDFVQEVRRYVRSENKKRFGVDKPVRVDIVAHSMGGLIARYMLRYGKQNLPGKLNWAGANLVNKVIIVGTPNSGSIDSLLQLERGFKPAPTLPEYSTAILGSMPAIYQLLPRARHHSLVIKGPRTPLDIMDPKIWERYGIGLADPSIDEDLKLILPEAKSREERRAIALDHLRKCLTRAELFHKALDRPASPPSGTKLLLFSGDAILCNAAARVDTTTNEITVVSSEMGDGTVIRSSTLMDERKGSDRAGRKLISPIAWDQVTFLHTDHIGLTKDPVFSDTVLFHLLEAN